MTIGEKYGPAMDVSTEIEAREYFEKLVQHSMKVANRTREDAEWLEKTNIRYYSGYYDQQTRERVLALYQPVWRQS
jgi:hypothetical protein